MPGKPGMDSAQTHRNKRLATKKLEQSPLLAWSVGLSREPTGTHEFADGAMSISEAVLAAGCEQPCVQYVREGTCPWQFHNFAKRQIVSIILHFARQGFLASKDDHSKSSAGSVENIFFGHSS